MFHSRALNNKSNCIHDSSKNNICRQNLNFQQLLQNGNSVSIHLSNLQVLATEMIKGNAQVLFLCNPQKSGASPVCINIPKITQKILTKDISLAGNRNLAVDGCPSKKYLLKQSALSINATYIVFL